MEIMVRRPVLGFLFEEIPDFTKPVGMLARRNKEIVGTVPSIRARRLWCQTGVIFLRPGIEPVLEVSSLYNNHITNLMS